MENLLCFFFFFFGFFLGGGGGWVNRLVPKDKRFLANCACMVRELAGGGCVAVALCLERHMTPDT